MGFEPDRPSSPNPCNQIAHTRSTGGVEFAAGEDAIARLEVRGHALVVPDDRASQSNPRAELGARADHDVSFDARTRALCGGERGGVREGNRIEIRGEVFGQRADRLPDEILGGEQLGADVRGTRGELRRDPMAMLPFCGYNMADYWAHWLRVGARADARLPRVYFVNWFRKNAAGRFPVARLR